MKVFIVFAHPEPSSFNGALKNVAVSTLERLGHEVVVSDLYRMGFDPASGPDDFNQGRADPNDLDLLASKSMPSHKRAKVQTSRPSKAR